MAMNGNMLEDDGPEAARRTSSEVPPASWLGIRWLFCASVLVSVVLAAGVYWIHQLPIVSQDHVDNSTVEVRLVQEPITQRSSASGPSKPVVSEGIAEPLIAAPIKPIPEQREMAAPIQPAIPAESNAVQQLETSPNFPQIKQAVAAGSAAAFRRLLLSHISHFLRYPNGVQQGDLHGVVQVLFSMRRNGSVSEVWVRNSSGHFQLDQAATETILRAQPLPEIPSDLPDTLTILLPLSFDAS